MWVECPTELDAPVLIFGFEVEDIAAVCAVMVFCGLFIFEGFPPVFFVTAGFGLALKRLKKGKAPGVCCCTSCTAGTSPTFPASCRCARFPIPRWWETSMKLPDLFGAGEVRLLRLEAATGLLALGCVLLACMLLWQRLSGLPVCYGTAQVAPGLVVPNEVPDAFVKALSEQIALVLYNITPHTAQAAHDKVAQLFHPQLSGHLPGAGGARKGDAARAQPEHATEHPQHGGGALRGRLRRPHRRPAAGVRGTLPIRDEELGVTLRFQRVQPSPLNPWGLAVTGLEFSEPLRAETG